MIDSSGAMRMLRTFLVTTDAGPLELSYTVLKEEGEPELRGAEATGPILVATQSVCATSDGSGKWQFTATNTGTTNLGCTLLYGGKLINGNSAYEEGAD